MSIDESGQVKQIYRRLYDRFGPQHWWPGETPFEVAVGAVLTQNTNWSNVEKAIGNLKQGGKLDPAILHRMPAESLASLIRPAGYFNIKAKRLKNLVGLVVNEYGGSMKAMAREPLPAIRKKLLAVNGVGPETADSIALYALEKPVFVIDAYTKRIFSRHRLMEQDSSYEEFQDFFHSNLTKDSCLFNEYHALLVRLAKENCRTKPHCCGCPLEEI